MKQTNPKQKFLSWLFPSFAFIKFMKLSSQRIGKSVWYVWLHPWFAAEHKISFFKSRCIALKVQLNIWVFLTEESRHWSPEKGREGEAVAIKYIWQVLHTHTLFRHQNAPSLTNLKSCLFSVWKNLLLLITATIVKNNLQRQLTEAKDLFIES